MGAALLAAVLLGADPLVVTAQAQFGERWNEPLFHEIEEEEADRDDEEVAFYSFQNFRLGLEQPIGPGRIQLRYDRRERSYKDLVLRDNTAHRLGLNLRLEPAAGWTIWLRAGTGRKTYVRSTLDNAPRDATVEARYRWGVRHNAGIGFTYGDARYDLEPGRDRQRRRLFAWWQRPLTDDLVLEVRGDVEERNFRIPSAARRNAHGQSVTVGIRWSVDDD